MNIIKGEIAHSEMREDGMYFINVYPEDREMLPAYIEKGLFFPPKGAIIYGYIAKVNDLNEKGKAFLNPDSTEKPFDAFLITKMDSKESKAKAIHAFIGLLVILLPISIIGTIIYFIFK